MESKVLREEDIKQIVMQYTDDYKCDKCYLAPADSFTWNTEMAREVLRARVNYE
jgi:hypothetical protein